MYRGICLGECLTPASPAEFTNSLWDKFNTSETLSFGFGEFFDCLY
jgi:hypothetical protein